MRWSASLRVSAVALVLAASAGCSAGLGHPNREVLVRRYLFGAIGGASADVRDLCPSGRAAHFRIVRSFGDYAVSVGTLGLYLPHRLQVRCDEAR